jgi:hypothetical protein
VSTGGIASIVIDSWAALTQLVEDSAGQGWVFRGESGINDSLRPKAGRTDGDRPALRVPYSVELERKALTAFKKRARPHVNHEPQNDLEWLAIAQHHGMSTRLLDWTENVFAAAYFATVDAGAEKKVGVIYGVAGVREVSDEEACKPFSLDGVRLYRPPHITPRVPAQASVFTVHRDPTENFRPATTNFGRWQIEHEACADIKRALDASGINEASLMPDIDGLSRYIGWLYKWGKLAP